MRASPQIDVAPTSRLRHEPRTAYGRPCRRANSHRRALRIPRAFRASGFVLRCTRFDTTSNEAITLSPKMSRASDSVLRESICAASSLLALPAATRPAVRCEGPTPRRARRVETRERSRFWSAYRKTKPRGVPPATGVASGPARFRLRVTTHGKRLVWLSHESSVMSNRN